MIVLNLLAIALTGYLLGSIPTSILAGKLLKGIDIREHGSGNAGATNVFRVLGWKAALAVMLVDVGKGVVATLFAPKILFVTISFNFVYLQLLAGLVAVLGHIWTIFAGFRGGKGVGTAAGMLFALYPIAGLVCLGIFLAVAFSTRYVSLASLSAAMALPIVLALLVKVFDKEVAQPLQVFSILIALLIIFTHRSNIQRLLSGTENRFGQKPAK